MDYSVIIPVYNCKMYLKDCVHSIRFAEIEEYEILLIDDGSTDGSGALCDELAACYPEVRVIHQENGGVSSARNRGIQEAFGEYILFVDSDDTLKSDWLRELVRQFPESGADLGIFGISFDYYRNKKCYRREEMAYPEKGLLPYEHWASNFGKMYDTNSFSSSCTKILRREILMKHQLRYSEEMFLYEDLEFILQYLTYCSTIYNDPRAIYCYRQTEDEGNAKRRLSRIGSISEIINAIEMTLERLVKSRPGVNGADEILIQLYHVLAREKISGSTLAQIRQICDDYARWYQTHELPKQDSKFHHRLMGRNALALKFEDRKTALRHWIAVRVKAFVRRTWE